MKRIVSQNANASQLAFDFDSLTNLPTVELAEIRLTITPLPETQEQWWSELEYKRIPRKHGIYAIINMLNGHFYIGSATNLYKRKSSHFSYLCKNEHVNGYLQNAYNRYGLDAFRFCIVERVEIAEDLIEREQHYIDTLNPEYNINPTAGSRLGRKTSEETKAKLSAIQKGKPGKPHSEATKARMSEVRKGKPRKPFSEEHKANLRKPKSEQHKANLSTSKKGKPNGRLGKPHSEGTKAKIGKANKGKTTSEQTRARQSEAKKGKTHSEASKAKMSKAMKGKPANNKGKPMSPASIAKREATKRAKRAIDPAYGTKKAK